MADIKKNAKAGNMVSRGICGYIPDAELRPVFRLTLERMQDPSQGSSPYTTIYPEIHSDASPTTSRLAAYADIEE